MHRSTRPSFRCERPLRPIVPWDHLSATTKGRLGCLAPELAYGRGDSSFVSLPFAPVHRGDISFALFPAISPNLKQIPYRETVGARTVSGNKHHWFPAPCHQPFFGNSGAADMFPANSVPPTCFRQTRCRQNVSGNLGATNLFPALAPLVPLNWFPAH